MEPCAGTLATIAATADRLMACRYYLDIACVAARVEKRGAAGAGRNGRCTRDGNVLIFRVSNPMEHASKTVAIPGFTFFRPRQPAADIIGSIWDVDLRDAEFAGDFTLKVLPSVSPTLCVHHARPTVSDHWANTHHRQRVCGIQTTPVSLRPGGPVGAVIVHLRPEAACRIMGGRMDEFTDTNIGIADLLSPSETSLLEEMLAEASGPAERAERLEAFLLRHMRAAAPDATVSHAVLMLRRNPGLGVRRLAADLGISERQLGRRFQAMVGTNVKQFARIVRLGKVVTARRRGAGWADIAYAFGFNDQAHLVNDFRAMAQSPPDAFFRGASTKYGAFNAALAAVSDFSNTFIV